MAGSKYSSIQYLDVAKERAEKELKFTVECKNTGRVYVYDLSEKSYSMDFREILSVVAWALYCRRNKMGHLSRISIIGILPKFFNFLRQVLIFRIEHLSGDSLRHFAEWLKKDPELSYSTAGSLYRKLSPIFVQMSAHDKVDDGFVPVRNAFPKSSELVSACNGYDQLELKSIVSAAVKGMRESASRLEKRYQPKWLGKSPPLDDVAPVGPRGKRSYWASEEYRIWWWENNCGCKRLSVNELFKLPKGQVFFNSLSISQESASVKLLNEFYDRIGAADRYVPSYIGKPCPISYGTPWRKKDYLVWYWENKLDCKALSIAEINDVAPEFWRAIKEYFGGKISEFYNELGVYRWVRAEDIIPYYLLLLIRTQLNPSTIQRLTVDCLIPDPLDDDRMMIDWTKFRSFKKGMSIPVDKIKDGWPVMIISRVVAITSQIRGIGQKDLWIANSNRYKISCVLENSSFKKGLQAFSRKYALTGSDGKPLSIQARLIRPTMAWSEYLRTEDMLYLQTLLGHSRLSTTADYLRRLDDPVLLTRRAIHQDAMFIGVTSGDKFSLICNDVDEAINVDDGHESLLNHCKNPLDSPVPGQKTGVACSANSEVCLGCQNLIVTPLDIKKYFCFLIFYDYLLQVGDLTEAEYEKVVSEKRFIWNNYILKKYDADFVERIRSDASFYPIPEWDVSLYEGGGNE